MTPQRCRGRQTGAQCELGFEARAEQVQNQIDAGTLLGDVVLEIGEQTLVAKIDLRRQADQKDIDVERCEPEKPSQLRQSQVDTALLGLSAPRLDPRRQPLESDRAVRI